MIRINKPQQGPTIPYEIGKEGQCRLTNATTRLKERFDKFIAGGGDRAKFNFTPNTGLYGHDIIKTRLKHEIQYNKCCYCEKRINDGYEVEHYRPKDAYKQTKNEGEESTTPGYYWLTYVWSNLFYSCGPCNKEKSTYFPLVDPANRATDHDDENCEHEEPLLINLVEEDPRDFIEFKWLEAFPVVNDNYERGKLMIEAVGLNRQGLFDDRKEYWDTIIGAKEAREKRIKRLGIERCQEEITDHQEYLTEKQNINAPFSAMINDNIEFLRIAI